MPESTSDCTPLRIAIMGTRGIPAAYGGFETFAEELSKRLVLRGHKVSVYGRRGFFKTQEGPRNYKGVEILSSPTIFHKYLETPLSFLTAAISLLWRRPRFDCVLLCNAANSPFAWIPRMLGTAVLINVDGIERMRAKWNRLGKCWYLFGERCAVLFASKVISDAKVIGDYYQEEYGVCSEIISYGASATHRAGGQTLKQFHLEESKYLLYVSRLEPENNALGVIQAYRESGAKIPLVIVGDAPYASEYKEKLRKAAEGLSVIFTGYQFGSAYEELQSNCLLYIQATEVGGTHPALIESMAYGNCIIANGTPENIEVLGESGKLYRKNDFSHLAELLRELLPDSGKQESFRKLARERAESSYNWEKVLLQYEELFHRILAKRKI